ncbi:hypothetical protein K7432_000070 [Basidiobolus ranarum]|uniref:Glycoside hydrolase n=1 Tax=Basidiobolus ranarum TaxID=34480 RepID=A0ABR2WBS4_9FUNG
MSTTFSLDGPWFKDNLGRRVILRGVNLAGSSKTPPLVPSHERKLFFQHRTVSFINRPFPLEEADEHFGRLRAWGFNFLRLLVPWEALEHAGPGEYDVEYMDYLVEIFKKAREYEFKCFIDPHQDVWSRFTGGSGAPGWTLTLAGLDMTQFQDTEAAIVHNTYSEPTNFPKMIWSTNYYKLATATMFTLFFGGSIFAKKFIVDGVNIQEYLQTKYFQAYKVLAKRIVDEGLDDVVTGYDTLNEPSKGWIGTKNLQYISDDQVLKKGVTPTPFQTMLMGEGHACTVETWDVGSFGPRRKGSIRIDPHGNSAWLKSKDQFSNSESDKFDEYSWDATFFGGCIWAEHGVWDRSTGKLLKPDYFSNFPETDIPVDFEEHCWKPFVNRFASAVRSAQPNAIVFIEPPVNEIPPQWNDSDTKNIVFAPHFYDGLTLVNKHWSWWNIDFVGYKRGHYKTILQALRFGSKAVRQCFVDQLRIIKDEGTRYIGNYPCLIGEIGIPFDMDDKVAYRTNDYSQQILAMDANLNALEKNLLHFTLWTYCPDNCHYWGDQWNGEDLSIFSRSTQALKSRKHSSNKFKDSTRNEISHPTTKELDNIFQTSDGGRALSAIIRPYPMAVCGEPISLDFDRLSGKFHFTYEHQENASTNTNLIYVPRLQYPENECHVIISSGTWKWKDADIGFLEWTCDEPGFQVIRVFREQVNGQLVKQFPKNEVSYCQIL